MQIVIDPCTVLVLSWVISEEKRVVQSHPLLKNEITTCSFDLQHRLEPRGH